jgi:predicted AAA+ superfamily ATPase
MIVRCKKQEILTDLDRKIVILSGPRQCGKTTLAKELFPEFEYLNYDQRDHREKILGQVWNRDKPLLIFDEIHKMEGWKRYLKGLYDVEGCRPRILVTGSAKMDVFRKTGDSLAGRCFSYRLNPFDIKEVHQQLHLSPQECLELFLKFGNFPEPFLSQSESFYRRWSRHHLDAILREDLMDLSVVYDRPKLELLVELLRSRVGSTVSYANLARDLGKDANTIKRWLVLLENLYIIFRVTPYHKNIMRSILKEPKFYFYDINQVKDPAAKIENLVAFSLLNQMQSIEDSEGKKASLHFLRTREGKEVDFLTSIDTIPQKIIEVKTSDKTLSPSLQYFKDQIPGVEAIQLVKDVQSPMSNAKGIRLEPMAGWLAQ